MRDATTQSSVSFVIFSLHYNQDIIEPQKGQHKARTLRRLWPEHVALEEDEPARTLGVLGVDGWKQQFNLNNTYTQLASKWWLGG